MTVLTKLICALLVALAAPAWADVSRDAAVAAAQRVASGRVLAVERTQVGSRAVWRVKILTAQGQVTVILIDVATGQPV